MRLPWALRKWRCLGGKSCGNSSCGISCAGHSLERILPEAAVWPQPARQTVTLDGRDDFAKHFMVSAAIAAYADTALSDAIGLYKEIEDSRIGSGFSFNDIAADRAGTKFGEKAVVSEASAQQLQRRVAQGLRIRI